MGRSMEELAELIRKYPGMNHKYNGYEIEEMRTWIKKPYNSQYWNRKVDRMSNAQVIAIFRQMCKAGRFTCTVPSTKKKEPKWHQMTIWDYIPESKKEDEHEKVDA